MYGVKNILKIVTCLKIPQNIAIQRKNIAIYHKLFLKENSPGIILRGDRPNLQIS